MKTGAWFYKTMPQFEVPPPRANNSSNGSGSTAGHSHLHLLAPMSVAAAPKPAKLRIQCVDTSSEEDDDVDDDGTDGTSSTASERYFMRERPSSCKCEAMGGVEVVFGYKTIIPYHIIIYEYMTL